MTTREALLARIELFLGQHGLSERRFGILAANDHKLIDRIRYQSVTLARIEATERFMDSYAASASAEGPPPDSGVEAAR